MSYMLSVDDARGYFGAGSLEVEVYAALLESAGADAHRYVGSPRVLELLHRRGIHAKPWEVERALSHLTLAGFLESRRMPSRAQSGYRVRGATHHPQRDP